MRKAFGKGFDNFSRRYHHYKSGYFVLFDLEIHSINRYQVQSFCSLWDNKVDVLYFLHNNIDSPFLLLIDLRLGYLFFHSFNICLHKALKRHSIAQLLDYWQDLKSRDLQSNHLKVFSIDLALEKLYNTIVRILLFL